jgi:hypothetical protein
MNIAPDSGRYQVDVNLGASQPTSSIVASGDALPANWLPQPAWPPPGSAWPYTDSIPASPDLPYSVPPPVQAPRKSAWSRARTAATVGIAVLFVAAAVAGVVILAGRAPQTPGNSNSLAVAGPSSASTPSGFTSFRDQADHFSIAVPSSWTEVNPESATSIAAFTEVEQNNPDLEPVVGSASTLVARGMRFLAIDTASPDSQPSTITVTTEANPGFQDNEFSQLAAALPSEYAKLGATILSSNTVSLPGGQALQVSVQLPLTDDSGNQTILNETQYYFVSSDFIYVLTGSGPAIATIAATFRTQF